jgi:tape measure domain-containing protein
MVTQSKIEAILSVKDTNMSSGIGLATKGLQGLQKEAETLKGKLSGLSGMKVAIGGLAAGGVAAGAAAYYANEVRKIADEYTNLNSRLNLVTDGEQDLTMVRERLYQISQETGTEYAGNADSYAKLARAVKDLGGNSEETLQITELVNKSLIVNGSSSEMAKSFMLQFAQAMGSGVLQGDEFRAMLESNSFFASQLAKALNTNIAGLRDMSKNGELTADKLRAAFPKMSQAINSEFSKISPTVERAMIVLENSFKRIVDESNRASGGTGSISKSIVNLAETIDRNRDGIISLFTKLIDLGAWSTEKVAGIGTELEVLGQVAKGNLGFFDYIKMTSVEEMHSWLQKNVVALKDTGNAAKQAGKEVSDSAKQSAAAQKQATGEALKEMKKKYQDYAKEIRQLQGDILGREKSLTAELRDMARSGMSDYSAWQDQKREAQEYEAAAKKAAKEAAAAMNAGDNITAGEKWKQAVGYADQAKQSYSRLNEEVTDGDTVLISKQQALKTAMDGVKSAGELSISIIKQQQAATAGAMNSLTEQSGYANLADGMTKAEQQWLTSWENMKNAAGEKINLVKQQIDSMGTNAEQVKEKIKNAFADVFQPPEDGNWGKVWAAMESGSKSSAGTVTSDWEKVWDQFLASGSEDIAALENKLTELTKDRHVKVYVESVQQNRWGGLIGAYQTGGQVSRFARGGKLPGYGGGDRVRALLEPGEFVVRKEAVARYGVGYLQALNSMRLNDISTVKARIGGLIAGANKAAYQRFQQGGLAAAQAPAETVNLNLTLPGSTHAYPMVIGKEHIPQLLRAVEAYNRTRSRNR